MSGLEPTGVGTGPDTLTALRQGRIKNPAERLRAATQLFEGTFYQEMFKAMRETVPEGGAISGGSGQEMFESMLDQQVADAAAAQNERGIGSALYRYFTAALLSAGADSGGPPEIP